MPIETPRQGCRNSPRIQSQSGPILLEFGDVPPVMGFDAVEWKLCQDCGFAFSQYKSDNGWRKHLRRNDAFQLIAVRRFQRCAEEGAELQHTERLVPEYHHVFRAGIRNNARVNSGLRHCKSETVQSRIRSVRRNK